MIFASILYGKAFIQCYPKQNWVVFAIAITVGGQMLVYHVRSNIATGLLYF